MSKNKKDKKKKKKQKQLEQVQAEQKKFDIIELLKTEQLDTKPNFAKFLDTYVEKITAVVNNGKAQFYPVLQYALTKVFVKFLDGHELIYIETVLPEQPHYYLYDGMDEVQLKQKEIDLVEKFFSYIWEFKFVYQAK